MNLINVHSRDYITTTGIRGIYFTDGDTYDERSKEIPNFKEWASDWQEATIAAKNPPPGLEEGSWTGIP